MIYEVVEPETQPSPIVKVNQVVPMTEEPEMYSLGFNFGEESEKDKDSELSDTPKKIKKRDKIREEMRDLVGRTDFTD